MTQHQLQLGIAAVLAVAVVAAFFIFNPFTTTNSLEPVTGASTDTATLAVQDELMGTGAVAEPGDIVSVNYTGKLANGTVFDTSVGKVPFMFTIGNGDVIKGWDQGVVGMKVGGKRTLIVPPSLGYGSVDHGPIPANSTLTFEIELLKVTPPSQASPVLEGPAAE